MKQIEIGHLQANFATVNTSRSNIKHVPGMVVVGDLGNGSPFANFATVNTSRSNIKHQATVAAPFVPGGAALAMPGDPVPGIDVKLGRNPGSQ